MIKKIYELSGLNSPSLTGTVFVVDDNQTGNYVTQKMTFQTLFNSLKIDMPPEISTTLSVILEPLIFDTVYPKGSLYITTSDNPPSRGTWELVAEDKCLWGVSASVEAGEIIDQGLPPLPELSVTDNGHSHTFYATSSKGSGSHLDGGGNHGDGTRQTGSATTGIKVTAGESDVYGTSIFVRPPSYTVHIYRRTA